MNPQTDGSDGPLAGRAILAHWGFVYDYDDDERGGGFVTGQLLLRDDGELLMRMGHSRTGRGVTTWRFTTPWAPMPGWTRTTDMDAALSALINRGYGVSEVDPTPWDADESGPFDGDPQRSRPLTPPTRGASSD